jgi:hypothetical protein
MRTTQLPVPLQAPSICTSSARPVSAWQLPSGQASIAGLPICGNTAMS